MTAVGTATRGRRVNGRRAAADHELNVEAIREEFPALAQRIHGHPLVYLDSAATTHRPLSVLDAMDEFYRRDNSNTHSEIHELGSRAKRRQSDARKTVAKFINAEQPEEVVWVRGTTEGINVIARTWAEEGRARRISSSTCRQRTATSSPSPDTSWVVRSAWACSGRAWSCSSR